LVRRLKVMKISTKIVLALLATSATNAWATDGTIGATSAATTAMTLTTPDLIELTNVLDPIVNVASYSGSGGVDVTDDVCVYNNDGADNGGSQQYRVTAAGTHIADGTAGALFYLKGSGSNTIEYTVAWNDVASSNVGEAALTGGSQLVTLQTGATGTYPCVTDNARYHIVIDNDDILSKPADTYTDTLTLTLEADDS
jgi:hypothetical protein